MSKCFVAKSLISSSLQCVCGGVRGDPTNVTPFHTHSTVPDTPQQPRLSYKTKTSLQFRYVSVLLSLLH